MEQSSVCVCKCVPLAHNPDFRQWTWEEVMLVQGIIHVPIWHVLHQQDTLAQGLVHMSTKKLDQMGAAQLTAYKWKRRA